MLRNGIASARNLSRANPRSHWRWSARGSLLTSDGAGCEYWSGHPRRWNLPFGSQLRAAAGPGRDPRSPGRTRHQFTPATPARSARPHRSRPSSNGFRHHWCRPARPRPRSGRHGPAFGRPKLAPGRSVLPTRLSAIGKTVSAICQFVAHRQYVHHLPRVRFSAFRNSISISHSASTSGRAEGNDLVALSIDPESDLCARAQRVCCNNTTGRGV